MSIKLCLLRNGETVVADVKEMIDPAGNEAAGYLLSDPFSIVSSDTVGVSFTEDGGSTTTKSSGNELHFSRLFPLSNDRGFQVTYDFVDVIYSPHKDVEKLYLEVVSQWVSENVKTIELNSKENFLIHSEDIDDQEQKLLDNMENLEVKY